MTGAVVAGNGDLIPLSKESLTPAEFNALSDISLELEWLANITKYHNSEPKSSMSPTF